MVAIVSLALGIGANTAVFSVVHAVLLDPLPYRGVVREMDPALPVFALRALDDVLSASVAPPHASMMLLGILGAWDCSSR